MLTPDEAVAFVQQLKDGYNLRKSIFWGIRKHGTLEIFGTICLWHFLRTVSMQKSVLN